MSCQICVGAMDEQAVYDCGHRICVLCSVRLVFLYKQAHCPLCKQPAGSVVFSNSGTIQRLTNSLKASKPRLIYENSEMKETVENLLSIRCQKCSKTFQTFKQLKRHYLEHGVVLCSECVEHKKDFWNEIKLYTSNTIKDHKNGKLGEEGFSGHVYCIHCRIHLFDSDHAKKHCNLKHELCHICDMLGMKYRYYSGFDDLEKHYKNAHYCCKFQECQINKCYVYPYKTELLEHLIRFHKINVKISEMAAHGRCTLPVMSPFNEEKKNIQSVVLDPNGRRITTSLVAQIQRTSISPTPSTGLPTYLDRNVLADEKRKERRRRYWMDRICKAEADQVENIINEFLSGSITVKDAFDRVRDLVCGKDALKLFESIHFESRQQIVSEGIKMFRKDVMFPKFVPSEQVVYEEPEHRKKPGFRTTGLVKKK